MTSNKKNLSLFLIGLFFCSSSTLAYEHSQESLKHIKIAKQYFDHDEYDEATLELEKSLKLEPQSPDVLNNLGSIYLRISQNTTDAITHNKNLNIAKNYFSQALKIDPNFSAAWNSLADIYYLNGESDKAISYYKKALALSPKHPFELRTNLANVQRDSHLNSEAEENYKKAIELNPFYAPAYNGYAELLYTKGDLAGARLQVKQAIKLKPEYATAFYHLGLIETARGNKVDALKAYLLSLRYETNPNYTKQTQLLIDQLDLNKKNISDQDLKAYQLSLSPAIAETSKSTGSESTLTEEQKHAPLAFAPPIETDNRKVIKKAQLLMTKRDWTHARNELSNLLKTNPNDPVILNELGLVMLNQGKYSTAETLFQKAIFSSKNKSDAAFYNLGQVYLVHNKLGEAQKCFEKAKTLVEPKDIDNALINNALAIVLKRQGDLVAAESAYRLAIANSANHYPVIHYNLAVLLGEMKKTKEAIDEFKLYLKLSPNGLNAKKAHQYLGKLSQNKPAS